MQCFYNCSLCIYCISIDYGRVQTKIVFVYSAPPSHQLHMRQLMQSIFIPFHQSSLIFPWLNPQPALMLEGALSRPLRFTALCRGSEVWEMWCMWPKGCTNAVFRMTLPVPAAMGHYSCIRSYSHCTSTPICWRKTTVHQIDFLYCLDDATSWFTGICFKYEQSPLDTFFFHLVIEL